VIDAPGAPEPLSLAVYRAATGLASPFVGGLLQARARRGKENPDRVGERLGHASAPRPEQPLVWLHGASVGECVSLLPLIAGLKREASRFALLLTSGTRASAEVMAERLPAGVVHQYAPVDTPGAVSRFLDHWRPAVGVFAESELWPNLIFAARRRGVRLALVSARLTQRTEAWRASPALIKAMLRSFDLILPQDAATEQRVATFGGRSSGRLNLKRVGDALPVDAGELARLQQSVARRVVIAGVSTHEPEERLIARAADGLPGEPLILIVPRHPERGARVAAELRSLLTPDEVALRSVQEPITSRTRVYVADTLGELGLFLRVASFAVMGKSFGSETGGHNPLEPARLGVGVVSGPAVSNFADIFAEMAAAGAAIVVPRPEELGQALARLLDEPGRIERLSAAARDYARRQEGQLGAALDLIRPLLPAS
jgi:3-deoxy-D-manno-octulosonic-acid transferase